MATITATPRKEYICEVCGKVSTRAFNHQEHERTHNPPEQQCPYCPKVFKSLSSLAGHVARHKKEGSRVNRSTQRITPEVSIAQPKPPQGEKAHHQLPGFHELDSKIPYTDPSSYGYRTSRDFGLKNGIRPELVYPPSYRDVDMRSLPSRAQSPRIPRDSRGEAYIRLPPIMPPQQPSDNHRPSHRPTHRGLHIDPPSRRPGSFISPSSEISPLPEDWSDSDEAGSDVSDVQRRRYIGSSR